MTDNLPPLLFDVHNKHEMTKTDLKQVVAIMVINRLQEWCLQLLKITIYCVVGMCGEESPSEETKTPISQKKTKLADLEMKVLRHLMSPQLTKASRAGSRRPKRRPMSRPPSPQLFDIAEEE